MAWYDSSWGWRTPITIQSSQVGSTLTDYPLYIDLYTVEESDFWDNVDTLNGEDLRATTDDGSTEMPIEVVSIGSGQIYGDGEVHTKVPTVSATSDTTIYLYHDNASASGYSATDTYGRNAVWSDYVLVYHLSDDPSGGTATDSAGNYDGTPGGSMTSGDLVGGAVGDGWDLDGTDDWIDTGLQTIDSYTYSFWLKTTQSSEMQFGGRQSANPDYFAILYLMYNDNVDVITIRVEAPLNVDDIQSDYTTSSDVDDGNWHLYTYSGDFSNGEPLLSQDGTSGTGTEDNKNIMSSYSISNFGIGAYNNKGSPVVFADAAVDEFRIYDGITSSEWRSAEYTNQNTPTTFYSVGTPEQDSSGTSTTFNVDALLQATDETSTFTTDALLQEQGLTVTYDFDAVIKARSSTSFTTDALIQSLGETSSFSFDSLLQTTDESTTYTFDTLIQVLDETSTATFDAILNKPDSATFTADALLKQEDATQSFSMSALVQSTDNTSTFGFDAVLFLQSTTTLAVDAVLKALDETSSLSFDALIQALDETTTFSTDALLQVQDETSSFGIDAVITGEDSSPFSVDALLQALDETTTASFDTTILRPDNTTTFSTDTVLKAVDESSTFSFTTQVQTTDETTTFGIDTILTSGTTTTTADCSFDAILITGLTHTLRQDQKSIFSDLGQTATLTKITRTRDDEDDVTSVTTTDVTITIDLQPVTDKDREHHPPGLIKTGARKAYVNHEYSSGGTGYTVEPGDIITDGSGTKWRVETVEREDYVESESEALRKVLLNRLE